MRSLVWTANVLGWPIIQLGIARWMLNRPASFFENDNCISQERKWERRGSIYRRFFLVPRWKRFLPDGARWLGGAPKKLILGDAPAAYMRLLAETRRAELAHWYMLLCTPIFFLWNPPWACLIMLAYGILSNLPCILSQRFNRIRLHRTLSGKPDHEGRSKRRIVSY